MKVVIGNDHAACKMKEELVAYIKSLGHDVLNVGTNAEASCDYPDYAYKACEKIVNKECDLGVLICGTGVGMSIAANKVKGIRACACSESYSARMSREHNDANVVCFGQRVVGIETAKEIVKAFLAAKFLGMHHENRIKKISEIESGTFNVQ